MTVLTLRFADIGPDELPQVGGKGANLGALARAGLPVPPGFCVTTAAYALFLDGLEDGEARFASLDRLDGKDVEATRKAAAEMRAALESIAIPGEVASAVIVAWKELGSGAPLAVRSSATAEDLPGASFAGQQDTYLNIHGEAQLVDAVRRCWISLFTDRAVLYRARNGFGHRQVELSVVVQELIDPDVSGILFTADPITGHRGITSIDAGFGLGEALVSGLISADLYKVERKSRTIIEVTPGDKAFAIRSEPGGGTRREELSAERRKARALDDAQVLALADIGERIEAQYRGVPQDIEWCVAGGKIYIVQARPITSLYPIPIADDDDGKMRIFLSFGHLQMMTDAMPRMAQEVWRYFFPAGKRHTSLLVPARLSPFMVSAGSRLFVDVTRPLRAPRSRKVALAGLTYAYADLAKSARLLASRPEFAQARGSALRVARAALRILSPVLARVPFLFLFVDPARRAAQVNASFDRYAADARARIAAAGTLSAQIRRCAIELNACFGEVKRNLAPVITGVLAHRLLAKMVHAPWGEGVRGEVERLLIGAPGNVTTEMDLAVGDLADIARAHAELTALLRDRPWSEIQAKLPSVAGGPELAEAIAKFFERYGDRGASEIDISRPRWREDPTMLLRVMTGQLAAGGAPGAHRQRRVQQVADGEEAQRRLVAAARGGLRRFWVRRLCRLARFGLGLREHPKFGIVRVLGLVRRHALEAGAALAQRGQLARASQVWHLSFDELAGCLDDPQRDVRAEVARRETAFRLDQTRRPPLAISSEGETPILQTDATDLPDGAFSGTAASSGVVEGIARVIHNPDREVLHAGEILVAPFTDPGWTPLFVHAAGVVTEVGGVLTHGAVVAREYGIPAVVSVAHATERIQTGQRIRVDGTRGFVQILEPK